MTELAPILDHPSRDASLELAHLDRADLEHAVRITDRVWWVGHLLDDDNFQCHVYLIEQGDQSVLLDIGASPSFRHVLAKVEEVVSLRQIRWYVCHHQDPDITGALPLLDQLVSRDDAAIVTHWRCETLMRHYGLDLPFWRIEDHRWELPLEDRTLRFVLTPYLHFPGAFVTFDPKSGVLFSSDLFGGFTEEPRLLAASESYFDSMRLFHEHYMPSQEILLHGLSRIEPLPIRAIAPQHGSVIPQRLVRPIIDRLKTLECGLYLMVESDTDIHRLTEMNRVLRRALRSFTATRDFPDLLKQLVESVQDILPVDHLELYSESEEGAVCFSPSSRYKGVEAELPAVLEPWRDVTLDTWDPSRSYVSVGGGHGALVLPLFSPDADSLEGFALLVLSGPIEVGEIAERVLDRLSTPLAVALEREVLLRDVNQKRQSFYELAIRDPLTGLHNRLYLEESVQRLFGIHDRGAVPSVVVSMYDLDHFKSVNDTFGHGAGDEVLQAFARVLRSETREGDFAVRMGGEEMLTIHVCEPGEEGFTALAERVRRALAALDLGDAVGGRTVTVSVGVAPRESGESLKAVLTRADRALYRAKESGRNRVAAAP